MTAPRGKEKVFPAELKSLQHFHRANIASYSRLNFLVEAKKGKFLLRRVWPTNSKVTRATAWSDYPSVFLILSCGTSGEKYEETLNSLDNSQKEEFRVNFTRNVKWLGRLQGRLRARGGTVFLSSATRDSRFALASLSPLFAWNTQNYACSADYVFPVKHLCLYNKILQTFDLLKKLFSIILPVT